MIGVDRIDSGYLGSWGKYWRPSDFRYHKVVFFGEQDIKKAGSVAL